MPLCRSTFPCGQCSNMEAGRVRTVGLPSSDESSKKLGRSHSGAGANLLSTQGGVRDVHLGVRVVGHRCQHCSDRLLVSPPRAQSSLFRPLCGNDVGCHGLLSQGSAKGDAKNGHSRVTRLVVFVVVQVVVVRTFVLRARVCPCARTHAPKQKWTSASALVPSAGQNSRYSFSCSPSLLLAVPPGRNPPSLGRDQG